MVVGNFNIEGMAIHPAKTNTPLRIDRYRMLPCAISGQGMQAVAGRNLQIIQGCGKIDIRQKGGPAFGTAFLALWLETISTRSDQREDR